MLFTSAPLARSQATSHLFKSFGANGEAPCAVGDSRISIISTVLSRSSDFLFAHLWAFTAAFLLRAKVGFGARTNVLQSSVTTLLFRNPPLVVTFTGKMDETRSSMMQSLGFSKQSQNKYSYFKGPASDDAITQCLQAGGEADAYSPFGTVNITGIVCLSIINRLLYSCLGFIGQWDPDFAEVLSSTEDGASYIDSASSSSWENVIITKPDHITQDGIFFCYFEGLVLPDKATTPREILSTFDKCLGVTGVDMLKAAKAIHEGWPSLSTTPQGQAISHLVFGLSLAISAKIPLRAVFIHNEYAGFVLCGKRFAVLKGTSSHKPISVDELKEELGRMSQHETAIKEIARILSDHKPTEAVEDKDYTITEADLTSPRKIHHLLRVRSFANDVQAQLRKEILRTRFNETSWDVSDHAKIATAIDHIIRKESLPVSAPFDLKAAYMFTSDPILSTLSAFGLRAPTLLGPDSGNLNGAITVSKSQKFFKEFKAASLPGVPIFFKATQQAFEDWETIMKTHVIQFKHSGNDKQGRIRIQGLGTMIPHDSKEAERIVRVLNNMAEQRGEKRKREGEGDEASNEARDLERMKKTKTKGNALEGLMNLGVVPGGQPPVAATGSTSMDVDEF